MSFLSVPTSSTCMISRQRKIFRLFTHGWGNAFYVPVVYVAAAIELDPHVQPASYLRPSTRLSGLPIFLAASTPSNLRNTRPYSSRYGRIHIIKTTCWDTHTYLIDLKSSKTASGCMERATGCFLRWYEDHTYSKRGGVRGSIAFSYSGSSYVVEL